MSLTPTQLRQSLRHARNSLSHLEQDQHAYQAFSHFQHNKTWLAARPHSTAADNKILLGFISTDGELATAKVLEWVLAQPDWQLALPVLGDQPGAMSCALWDGQTPLQSNRFGILEPKVEPGQPGLAIATISCVLMPLVAFDHHGHRMGMGGGYYDRLLADIADQPLEQRPWFLGWAHSLQQVDYLEPQPWDIGLDACITEQAYHRFSAI